MSVNQYYALFFSIMYLTVWAGGFLIYGMHERAGVACYRAIISSAKFCAGVAAFLTLRFLIGLLY